MSIPSQFPAVVATARNSALQALALQPGQVIEGKVLGPAPGGGTQVQIGEQVLNLALPVTTKPGTVLQFEVQTATAGQVRLVIQPQPGVIAQPVVVPSTPPPTEIFVSQAAFATAATSQPSVPSVAQPVPTGGGVVPTQAGQPAVASGAGTGAPVAQVVAAGAVPSTPAVGQAAPVVSAYVQAGAVVPAAPTAAGAAVIAAPVAAAPVAPVAGNGVQQAVVTAAPSAAAASVAAPVPMTPQAALTQMVQASVQRQDSAATLMTALSAIVGKVALPEQVMRAAQQVLAGRVSLDSSVDGAKLQQAVLRSGVFLEAGLAKGNAPVAGDMKGSLLALRQTLVNWLGQQPPVSQAPIVPPPLPGMQPRARQAMGGLTALSGAPEEAGKVLLDRTEATLARVRLHQSAALPDPAGKARPDISLDLPVLIGNYQTLLHLQVSRDGQGSAEHAEERGWQMRFAINMPDLGEVGAQVSLRGGATGVMLWASEPETAEALQGELAELKLALGEAGLKLGAVMVRRGEPAEPVARPGHFVDARS